MCCPRPPRKGGVEEVAIAVRAPYDEPHRTLAKQLRELKADGIIHREVHQQTPPNVEY
jgi:hypothetical protein